MPTHGDFPWERDERRRQEGRAPRATAALGTARRRPSPLRAAAGPILFVAALAAAGFAVQTRADRVPGVPGAPLPAPAPAAAPPMSGLLKTSPQRSHTSAPAEPYRLSGVHSRWRGRSVIEVWGRTTAPDGTTIRVSVSSGGVNRRLGLAPAASRRFYLRERVPEALRRRRLALRLRIVR